MGIWGDFSFQVDGESVSENDGQSPESRAETWTVFIALCSLAPALSKSSLMLVTN